MKILRFLFVLFMVFSLSCDDDSEKYEVPYTTCNCEDKKFTGNTEGYAYLFRDSIPEKIEAELFQKGVSSDKGSYWIVYYEKADSAVLYGFHSPLNIVCEICNFPEFAKKWEIPETGKKVHYIGKCYEPCIDKYGIDVVGSDLILTYFKPM